MLTIAVGLTRNASELDLIVISNAGSDYLRFTGGYFDIQNRVGDVERLLCAIRPKGKPLAMRACQSVSLAFVYITQTSTEVCIKQRKVKQRSSWAHRRNCLVLFLLDYIL